VREKVLNAWKRPGIEFVSDPNGVSNLGVSENLENFHNGKRQLASQAYNLTGVRVLTETPVDRILLGSQNGETVAIGVEFHNGQQVFARKE
jgi:hypothetical protein